MRVLHMIDWLKVGGAQKLLVTFGHEAARRGIQTSIVCLSAPENSQVEQELRALGVPVAFFPAQHLLDPGRLWRVAHHLRQTRPDVVQTHLLYANIVGGLTGFAVGRPVLATLHTAGPDIASSRGRDWLDAQVMQWLDRAVIAVGYKTAELHQPRVGKKAIHVIPNGVNIPAPLAPSERAALRREILGDEAKTMIIAVGRFSAVKAYGDLVRAFALLHPRCPQTVLVLVGDGIEKADTEALARTLGLAQAVRFLGNRGDVPRLMAASDLFVSSSVAEGMPLVVVEAMMAGLTIVATAVGDLPFMLADARGVVVPPSRPEQLAEALAGLLTDPAGWQTMGKRAQAYAQQNYSSAVWVDRLTQLYQEVMR